MQVQGVVQGALEVLVLVLALVVVAQTPGLGGGSAYTTVSRGGGWRSRPGAWLSALGPGGWMAYTLRCGARCVGGRRLHVRVKRQGAVCACGCVHALGWPFLAHTVHAKYPSHSNHPSRWSDLLIPFPAIQCMPPTIQLPPPPSFSPCAPPQAAALDMKRVEVLATKATGTMQLLGAVLEPEPSITLATQSQVSTVKAPAQPAKLDVITRIGRSMDSMKKTMHEYVAHNGCDGCGA